MNSRKVLAKRAPTQRKILDAIEDAGEPLGPKEISEATGINEGTVRSTVRKMEEKGLIHRPYDYGVYAPGPEPNDLHPIGEKPYKDVIQNDARESPPSNDSDTDTSTTRRRSAADNQEGERMELPRGGSLKRLDVPQFYDIWMLGEIIATVEFARIVPGKRKSVDITKAVFDMRYSPHDYPEITEGSHSEE